MARLRAKFCIHSLLRLSSRQKWQPSAKNLKIENRTYITTFYDSKWDGGQTDHASSSTFSFFF